MALMATAMGLGAYWTSWQEVAREALEMKAFLGAEPEDRVMCVGESGSLIGVGGEGGVLCFGV
jgi:hypothetical protein